MALPNTYTEYTATSSVGNLTRKWISVEQMEDDDYAPEDYFTHDEVSGGIEKGDSCVLPDEMNASSYTED